MLRKMNKFQKFDENWLHQLALNFIKAEVWQDYGEEGTTPQILGAKVTVQIVEDNNDYGAGAEDFSNLGELLVIKVRKQAPEAYEKLTPFTSELVISGIEKAVLWGERSFKNQLSLVGKLSTPKND